jgi:hypothetical protein
MILFNSFSVALTSNLLFLHRKQVVSAMSSLASIPSGVDLTSQAATLPA